MKELIPFLGGVYMNDLIEFIIGCILIDIVGFLLYKLIWIYAKWRLDL